MAFRTKCPACGTYISAPDNMYAREMKCPNCARLFLAELAEETPLVEPPETPERAPKYFCKVCNAGAAHRFA
jgi:hypothetical protein